MKKARCPICERHMPGPGAKEWPDWPFCSARCKLIDLGRWLDGRYAIQAPPDADEASDMDDDPGRQIGRSFDRFQ